MVSADSFSPVEAARVLGVSEKRIRQLVDAGRIRRVGTSAPLRVSQRSVLELRDKRKADGRATSTTSAGRASSSAVDVEAVVTRTVEALVPRMLETATAAARRTEAVLTEQLAAERARADQAEAALREARAQLAARPRLLRRRTAPAAR